MGRSDILSLSGLGHALKNDDGAVHDRISARREREAHDAATASRVAHHGLPEIDGHCGP